MKPIYKFKLRQTSDPMIDEVDVYKDGVFSHSVRCFLYPQKIEKLKYVRESIPKKSGRESDFCLELD